MIDFLAWVIVVLLFIGLSMLDKIRRDLKALREKIDARDGQ